MTEAAGTEGLTEWLLRLSWILLAAPILWITVQNERIHVLIRWWLKFLFAVLLIMLIMAVLGFGELTIR